MLQRPLSLDTSPEVERRQIAAWRRMSPAEKAAAVTAMTSAVMEMARAGVRHRHPGESERLQQRRLAELLFGPQLSRQIFPDLAGVP